MMPSSQILILGAGPAGMGCAHRLAQHGCAPSIIEREEEAGGLCRTLNFHGYLFDIGGHRFLTKSVEVNELWKDVMGDDLLHVKRLSRIYYRKRFFQYPLSFMNTFWNLGPLESARCIASYAWCKTTRLADESTYEGWIVNRFGRRLYDIFFKTYTEKVWAVPCDNLSARWAQQRIRGLSLRVALRQALGSNRQAPKTLAEEFLYPRTGPGEFYHRFMERIAARGGRFAFGKTVTGIRHDERRVIGVDTKDRRGGIEERWPVEQLFSSLPLPLLVKLLRPHAPEPVRTAAERLSFRSFIVVNVILDQANVFRDQWIYVQSPEVQMGRIQNYKNWSPAMVADARKTSLGLEYFCTEGDALWSMNDVDLIHVALEELERIGLASRRHLIDGFVVRRANVYPVYTLDYETHVATIRRYLEQLINLTTIGRGGLFRYDNSDYALLSGMYAAQNFLGADERDVWNVHPDQAEAYLEA